MGLPLPYWKEKRYRAPKVPKPAGHCVNTQNLWERAACERLWKEGWKVYKSGWPDFVAVRDGEIQFIEVKPPKSKRKRPAWLDPDQQRMAAILRRFYGIRVNVWNKYKDFWLTEFKSPPLDIQPPKRFSKKVGYGEHLIKTHLPTKKSLTETLPTQG